MSIDEQALRLEGIYKQNEGDEYMQRIKLPGGVLSRAQAETVARLGEKYGSGTLHLTTRASIEFHGLRETELPEVHRALAQVGLFSRGACGGAVRGISCSSSFGPGFGRVQVLLRHFLRYFSGNPHFEGVPKKFKIAFEAGYERSRHLIQDLALVLVEEQGVRSRYDVWVAGGLGREPQPGFLYADRVEEKELLPLTEAIIRAYKAWGVKGRRLKHMLNEIGEESLRARIAEHYRETDAVGFVDAFSKELLPDGRSTRIPLDLFAGELPACDLSRLVALCDDFRVDWLLVTPDQNLELLAEEEGMRLEEALRANGFVPLVGSGALRVCPGNHECRMGLSATRDLARRLLEIFGQRLTASSLAISGCANSCAQPQLAEFGIITSKLSKVEDERVPRFDLYRRIGHTALGERIRKQLEEEDLVRTLDELLPPGHLAAGKEFPPNCKVI